MRAFCATTKRDVHLSLMSEYRLRRPGDSLVHETAAPKVTDAAAHPPPYDKGTACQ